MTPTYFIGGIATDRQLYDYTIAQIPGAVYLPFPPHERGDTMATYARRFIPLIDTTAPFNIIANSMGGIITMELVKHIHPRKIILVSSVKCRAEMPLALRQLKYTRLHRFLPGKGFIAGVRWGSLFIKELRAIPGMRDVVIDMAHNNPPEFLSWCVQAIANWEGAADHRSDITHLHGTKDAMFPIKNIRNVLPVAGGSHNMLLTRREELIALIQQNL